MSLTCWHTEHLVQLESALQLYFAQPRVVGLLRSTDSLTLDDFYAFTRKLSLPPRGAGANEEQFNSDEKKEEVHKQDQLYDLDEMESLLFQLLCVSSPVLYRLVSANDGKDTKDKCSWCLEMTLTSENRLQRLRTLIKERNARESQTNAQAQIFLQAIQRHRQHRDTRQREKSSATTASSTAAQSSEKDIEVKDIVQPGMTIEERVRARANAKRKVQQEEENSRTTVSNEGDRSWLVRLADALWTHASSILQRKARFQSPRESIATPTATPAHCCLTLKDVISFLRKTMPLNKRKLAEGIQELHRIVPEWIFLSDPTSLSPDTTVWLNPAEYKTIRHRLTGEEPPLPPPKKKALLDVKTRSKVLTTKSATKEALPVASPFMKNSGAVQAADAKGPLNSLLSKIQPGATPPPAATTMRRRRRPPAVSMSPSFTGKPWSGVKRSPTETVASPVTKKRKGLRINPNLILTDADYQGGEVLGRRNSLEESPRGLKRLFDQMKAGRRI